MDRSSRLERGLWGLPSAQEVGSDLIVQMLDPGSHISTMECQQYFWGSESHLRKSGFHLDIKISQKELELQSLKIKNLDYSSCSVSLRIGNLKGSKLARAENLISFISKLTKKYRANLVLGESNSEDQIELNGKTISVKSIFGASG